MASEELIVETVWDLIVEPAKFVKKYWRGIAVGVIFGILITTLSFPVNTQQNYIIKYSSLEEFLNSVDSDKILDWNTYIELSSVNFLKAKDYLKNVEYVYGRVSFTDYNDRQLSFSIINDQGLMYPTMHIQCPKNIAYQIDTNDFVVVNVSIDVSNKYLDNDKSLFSKNFGTPWYEKPVIVYHEKGEV